MKASWEKTNESPVELADLFDGLAKHLLVFTKLQSQHMEKKLQADEQVLLKKSGYQPCPLDEDDEPQTKKALRQDQRRAKKIFKKIAKTQDTVL